MRHTPRMPNSASLYRRHRFPAEIISHCVWLYFRFALSFRDVEEMMARRGVSLTYETVRLSVSSSGRLMLSQDVKRVDQIPELRRMPVPTFGRFDFVSTQVRIFDEDP